MSGDLEDFLRRAAQRRQAKAAQQQQPATPRARPQYTDRRTERVVGRSVSEESLHDEVLTADVVQDESSSFAARLKRLEEAKRKAARAEAEATEKLKKIKKTRSKGSAASVAVSSNPATNLIAMLRTPGGIQQAILLREILDRPEHRW